MAQEIEAPIASVRTGGYKPGDEVTIGGKTLTVIATSPDGRPIFQPGADFVPDAPPGTATPKAKVSGGDLMPRIMAKRERIMSLPEDVRGIVVDRLFDKAVGPKIPKAMTADQRSLIKQRFVDSLTGKQPTPDTGPTDKEYKSAGLPTGMGGKIQQGVMGGLGNITSLLDKVTGNEGLQGSINSFTGSKTVLPEHSSLTTGLKDSEKVLSESTAAYTGRHPIKAGAAEFGGQLLPATVLEMLMPGAPPGASLGPKVLTGAAKGATGMIPFDPTPKGIGTGAALGATLPLAGKGLSKLKSMVTKPGAKVATKAAVAGIPGAAENASQVLDDLAQKKFGKALKELTPDQKIELVSKWREDSVGAAKTEKTAARAAAVKAKADAVVAKQAAKVDEKLAIRRAMNEAKQFQSRIAAFVKTHKRAPNAQELTDIKNATEPAAAAKPAAAAADAERGIKKPERRTFLRTEDKDVKEYYSYRFQQIRDEIKNAATPEEKASAENRLSKLSEVQKAHPTSMGDAHDFKIESPEAVKAVAAVADVSKVMGEVKTTVVPPGQSGLSPFQQTLSAKLDETTAKLAEASDPKVVSQLRKTIENIKKAINGDTGALTKLADAERKAAERLRAAAAPSVETSKIGTGKAGSSVAELVSDTADTPEAALLKKEEMFMELTDQIEGFGTKGKEAAKNLDKFRRSGRITMDQAIEMGNKVVAELQQRAK